MRRRQNKAKRGYRIILILAVIAIPLFYLGRRVYTFCDAVLEEKSLEKQRTVLRAENDVMKMRIDEYKQGILIETKAREDLGMIREGEKVYLVRKR